MAVVFPSKLMKEADHDWNISGNTKSAGQTVTLPNVTTRSDGGGFWVASLNNIRFWDGSDTLLWRALRQQCNGGVVPMVVPRNDIAFAPFPAGSAGSSLVTFSDGSKFSDGSSFSQSIINVVALSDGQLRSNTLQLQLNYCAPLQGGESFSIYHPTYGWRLYEIGSVLSVSDNVVSVTFNPPLREMVKAGEQLEFDLPRCTMKLLNPQAMDLNVTTWPFSLVSLKLIEAKLS